MRKGLIILAVLFGVFLAMGCMGNKQVTPNETETPRQDVTPVGVMTETMKETPVAETTPVSVGTPAGKETAETQNVTGTPGMKEYSLEELEQYNGQNGKTYVAYQGKVYDISASSDLWQNGMHHGHNAGQDFTEEMNKAPHGAAILKSYPVVGTLKQ